MSLAQPVFLTLEEVLAIHREEVQRFGGALDVRDRGLLQSAIAMPAMAFGGGPLHADLHEMAAAYLFHIVANHPFVDGNKRTGAAAAGVFLELNGLRLVADPSAYTELVLAVARGETGKSAIAEFFRANVSPA
jgi:death-on-curing protein